MKLSKYSYPLGGLGLVSYFAAKAVQATFTPSGSKTQSQKEIYTEAFGELSYKITNGDLQSILIAGCGGLATIFIIKAFISALGFKQDGISSRSYAAGMMSSTAIARGGGVPSGSNVANLQSVGAAGFSGFTKFLLFTFGGISILLFMSNQNKSALA